MKARILMVLLLGALAQPTRAEQAIGGVYISSTIQIAQLGADDRRTLRERWEQASPEERMEMRRLFQESQPRDARETGDSRRQPRDGRGYGTYPEQRPREQRDFPRMPSPSDFTGFGTGFEHRLPEGWVPPMNLQELDPRNVIPYPSGRNRR